MRNENKGENASSVKLKKDAGTIAKNAPMWHCIAISLECIWNIFFLTTSICEGCPEGEEGYISKMKNSSKSNFRAPPHCGCEASATPVFDMHFVFAEIESNAIARHYSSFHLQSSVSFSKNVFPFSICIIYFIVRIRLHVDPSCSLISRAIRHSNNYQDNFMSLHFNLSFLFSLFYPFLFNESLLWDA